jgi:hypothetical protein
MVASPFAKNHDLRAMLFGAHLYVGGPTTSVLTKALFCDGHHEMSELGCRLGQLAPASMPPSGGCASIDQICRS